MQRRTTLMLTGVGLLGLGIAALSHPVFAQSDPFVGTWQLNLAKSKYSLGPPPQNVIENVQGEGQNHKFTFTGVDASGNPISGVFTRTFDGMSHPSGATDFDAVALTRVDAYTTIISRTRGGRLVQTATDLVSPDGKTRTGTVTGTDANGQPFTNVIVYDKQ